MGFRGANFNNGFTANSGLALSFSRATATRDYANNVVASGSPRYGEMALLPSPPVVTTESNSTGVGYQILAAGVDADGSTPVWVLYNTTNSKLQVHVGSISIDGFGNSTYQVLTTPSVAKAVNGTPSPDALLESNDLSANESWIPKGGVVVHGVAYILCLVANDYYSGDATFRHSRIGIMSCKVSALAGAKETWWNREWLSADDPNLESYNPATYNMINTATGWALQTYSALDFDDGRPTSIWLGVASYQSTQKTGGTVYVCKATRSSNTSDDWTTGKFVRVYSDQRPLTESTCHVHNAIVVRHDTSGVGVLLSQGDGSANNCMQYIYRFDETYDDSAVSDGGNSINSYGSAVGWTTEIVNGRIGDGAGTPPATSDTPITSRRFGLQPFGGALVSYGGTMYTLWGADEQDCPITRCSYATSGMSAEFTPVFKWFRVDAVAGRTSTATTRNNTARLCFQITSRNPTKASTDYVAAITASSTYNVEWASQNSVAYSPDGQYWGTAFLSNEPEQSRPFIVADRIYQGSPTSGLGIRWTAVPEYVIYQPLCIGTGGKNYMVAVPTATKSGGMVAGDDLQTSVSLPVDYTPAPCAGPIYMVKAIGGTANTRCNWQMVTGTSMPVPFTGSDSNANAYVTIRGWIWAMKPRDYRSTGNGGVGSQDLTVPTDGTNSASQVFRMRAHFATSANTGSNFSGYSINKYVSANAGVPQPFEIKVLSSMYALTGTLWDANYRVNLYLESGSSDIPTAAYVQLEGVYAGTEYSSYPTAANTTGAAEAASITGYSCAGAWSAIFRGRTPWDAYWDMWHPQSYTNTMGTSPTTGNDRTSATVTRVYSVSTGRNSVTDVFANHRLFGEYTTSGVVQTVGGFPGILCSASSYVSSGVHDITHTSAAMNTGNVSSVSVANPTTITTSSAHNMATGQRVYISGTNTSASVNGGNIITVTGATTFTIPVNVTSVTTGTGTWNQCWSQLDVYAPQSTATDRALWSISNEAGTRAVTVFADHLNGRIKVAYYDGASYGTAAEITNVFWLPASPVHVGLTYSGTTLTIYASVNGSEIGSATTTATIAAGTLTRVRAGRYDGATVTPIEWFGAAVNETEAVSNMEELLTSEPDSVFGEFARLDRNAGSRPGRSWAVR